MLICRQLHYLLMIALTLTLILASTQSRSEGLILVSASEELKQPLSREQVRNLYMGASLGYDLKPLALPPQNRLRSQFNTQVIGLPESRIQSYWAQMKFTGRMAPPKEMRDEQTLLQQLLTNPDSIGYLPSDMPVPARLNVVFRCP